MRGEKVNTQACLNQDIDRIMAWQQERLTGRERVVYSVSWSSSNYMPEILPWMNAYFKNKLVHKKEVHSLK